MIFPKETTFTGVFQANRTWIAGKKRGFPQPDAPSGLDFHLLDDSVKQRFSAK
jgi:hypothetical protein